MSFLYDGVYSSVSYYGRGFFEFNRIGPENTKLLKSIKKRQRRRFKSEKKTIPQQLLQVLWHLEFLPGIEAPKEGMPVDALVELLHRGDYRNKKNRTLGVWLRDRIEAEEYPEPIYFNEKLILYGHSKSVFISVSVLREEPGTIFR